MAKAEFTSVTESDFEEKALELFKDLYIES